MIQLIRIIDDLPDGFDALLADAASEGGGELAGIGGLSIEAAAAKPARRVRRFYVRRAFRRQGVARTLASALVQEALDQVDLLTCNAASPAAAPFWEAQGFSPDTSGPWTHVLRRSLG